MKKERKSRQHYENKHKTTKMIGKYRKPTFKYNQDKQLLSRQNKENNWKTNKYQAI